MATDAGNALFKADDFEGAVASYAANLGALGFAVDATGPWNGEVPPKVIKRLEARKVVSVPAMLWFLFFTNRPKKHYHTVIMQNI